ncbi:MAG TPA: HAD family hydrolase [Mycobacteriales bacterium]|nr:HAD family hydrolase [Mycobacteriales bacterium]
MRPKVVATDLDGTVVRSDGTISPRTRDALLAARDAGALIVVATGRPPRWLTGIAEATGHDGIAVCANGALVYDLSAEQVIDSRPLDLDVVRLLIEGLRASVPGVAFAIERVDGQFAHEPDYHPRWEPEEQTFVGELEHVFDVPVVKLLGRVEGAGSDDLLAMARAAIGEELATLTHSSIDGLLEVNAYGVTKASTLDAWLADRGLSAADVIAFGDMPNDIEMIAWAGHGVAVANAHPEVLAVADEVTGTNDADGVAEVLERLFG